VTAAPMPIKRACAQRAITVYRLPRNASAVSDAPYSQRAGRLGKLCGVENCDMDGSQIATIDDLQLRLKQSNKQIVAARNQGV